MRQTYFEKCRQMVPVFRRKRGIITTQYGACPIQTMSTLPIADTEALTALRTQVEAALQCAGVQDKGRIIIATDDEQEAMKAATLLTMEQESGEAYVSDDEEDWGFVWDDEEIEEEIEVGCYAVLDAREYMREDKGLEQSFLIAEQFFNSNESCQAALFLGIGAVGNLKQYVHAVAACSKRQVFLHIPTKLLEDVDVQRLVYEHDFQILKLKSRDHAYFRHMLDELLSKSEWHLSKELDADVFLDKCRQRWLSELSEDRIAMALDFAALRAQSEGRTELCAQDFEPLLYIAKKDAYDELMEKTGLSSLKEISREFIALEQEKKRNPKAGTQKKHMLFYGRPGTGKTTGAEYLAKIMAEKGIGNGKFVTATRKDLIGRFVGHTAPLVAAKFAEAKGGILFVDEAGFFTQEGTGGYVQEALKEFVRYMETCEDVTVIFAMYPKEKQRFLNLDEGMSSRIAHMVKFEDYDMEQLAGITGEMLNERGYHLTKGCEKLLMEHFATLRESLKDDFGNARECRKLVDELVLAISLRNAQKKVKDMDAISSAELKKVLEKSLKKNGRQGGRFGFQLASDGPKCAVV